MKLFQRFFRYLSFSWKCKLVDFLLKRQGIEIRQAKTPEELDQVFHLRYEVYKDEDYIDPNDYPDQKLKDGYDSNSISFLAVKNGETVGTLRIIVYSEKGFPTENAFNILDFPFSREQINEISKLCVRKKFRGGTLSLGLFKKALDYSRKQHAKYWLLGTSPDLLKYFEMWCTLTPGSLSAGPLKSEHLRERVTAERYFQKSRVLPYILEIDKIR